MAETFTRTTIIKGETPHVYRLWTDFEKFPEFMQNVVSVERTGELTSRWTVEGPLGRPIVWEAKTTRIEPNRRIAWKSLHGDIKTSGQVTFTDLPGGETQVTLTVQFVPPAGKAGDLIARMIGQAEEKVTAELGNFKKFAEGMYERLPHPYQPPR